jgi:hypothetical protein
VPTRNGEWRMRTADGVEAWQHAELQTEKSMRWQGILPLSVLSE